MELNPEPEEIKRTEEKEIYKVDEPRDVVEDMVIQETPVDKTLKRKRKTEKVSDKKFLTDVYLRTTYPLTSCMIKNISIGISKYDCDPIILLAHGMNKIEFRETSWMSLNKYVNLIKCYLENQVFGKKTRFTLANSDIEIENVKMRSEYFIRFRNVSKHNEKILLNLEEIKVFFGVLPSIDRYLEQLKLSSLMIKDYLEGTVDKEVPILYGPVDPSIFNRLPQEVELNRLLQKDENKSNIDTYENGINLPEVEPLVTLHEYEGIDEVD